MEALEGKNVDEWIFSFHMLTNMIVIGEVDSVTRPAKRGTPQVDSILKGLEEYGVTVIGYGEFTDV